MQYQLSWKPYNNTTDMCELHSHGNKYIIFHHKKERSFYSLNEYVNNTVAGRIDVTFGDTETELHELLNDYLQQRRCQYETQPARIHCCKNCTGLP